MAKKWEEIKAVCDDPSVPSEKKQALLNSYLAENTGTPYDRYPNYSKLPKDSQEYIKAYNAFPQYGKTTDQTYKEASEAGSQASYNEREHKKEVDAGKKTLGEKKPPGSKGVGTKTSDELFDAAGASLKMFEDFIPLLGKLPSDCKGNTKALNFDSDIKKRFDEQRGISFQKFMEDADRFTAGAVSVDSTMTDSNTKVRTLFGTWQGDAADSASKHYNEKISAKARIVHENLTGSSTAIEAAATTVYELCKNKADAVVRAYTSQVGKADKAMAETVINIANDSHAGKDEMERVAGWMDINFGTNLRKALNDDGCCDDDDIKKEGIRLSKQWIQMHFNPHLWEILYQGFVKNCDNTKDLVDKAWDSLDKVMGEIKNEFEGAQEPTPPPPPPSNTGKRGNPSQPGGGGDSKPGGGGTTPSATPPPSANPSAGGTNPVTGKPLEVDPATGVPYPIDPKTGAAIKDAGDKPEKVTVEKGDNKITMTEPDKNGKMDVSVNDGAGHHKDYKLDFDDPAADKAAGAHADGKHGEFGPKGSEGTVKEGAPGGDGVHRPGPDGKIHIQDGNLKITAEQPQGPNGPTVVTVDDGKGEPTKYTLDENKTDPAKTEPKTNDKPVEGRPAVASHGESAAGGVNAGGHGAGGGNLEGVRTMPAEAGFSTPGGLNLAGDFTAGTAGVSLDGTAGGDAAGGGSVGGGAAADLEKTSLASSGGELFAGGPTGDSSSAMAGLGDTAGLQAGAQTGSDSSLASSDTGLGAAPGGMDPNGAQQPAGAGAGAGGMGSMGGMMGGMGGAGGGGGGGDQQRGSSQYKVEGALFETSGAGGRISGSLDDEGDRSIRYDR